MQHDALFVAMRAGNQRLLGIDWKIALASKQNVARLAPQSAKNQSFTPNVTNALRGVPTCRICKLPDGSAAALASVLRVEM